jgi:hypothetical protein
VTAPRPAGFDAVVGTDEDAAVLLPVCIGELAGALEKLVGTEELERQIGVWLDDRRTRLAGINGGSYARDHGILRDLGRFCVIIVNNKVPLAVDLIRNAARWPARWIAFLP